MDSRGSGHGFSFARAGAEGPVRAWFACRGVYAYTVAMPPENISHFGLNFRFWIPILGAALVFVAYAAYYRTTPSVPSPLRWLLVTLRAVSFGLLLLVLMDPRIVRVGERSEPARVVALVDRSASMGLGAGAWDGPAEPTRFDRAGELLEQLEREVSARGGILEPAWFATDVVFGRGDTLRADGQGTDIVGAVSGTADRYEGEHLAAIVLISDGVETEERIVRRALPDVPVFAVGVGDTTPPDDVRIADVDYNAVVHVPARATISASLTYTGAARKRVRIELREGSRAIFRQDTLVTAASREIEMKIPVRFVEPGRREFRLSVSVTGRDAEPDNNHRDIVIEAEKAKARILIVDLTPGWELHFLTEYLRRDQTFDFELVAPRSRPLPPTGRLIAPDAIVSRLAECDAVVLGAIDDGVLTPEVARAITRFVTDRGGGLLVLPGEASIFERAGAWRELGTILPLRGNPPFRFNLQYTSVMPGDQAAGNPITAQLLPLLSQSEWQERSPLLGYYGAVAPARVGDVLLTVRGRSLPAITYGTVGQGRVVAVSAGPLWRWKFLSDNNNVYDEIVSRIFDVLSRGEDTDRFVLSARKNVFEAGEGPVFFAELFNERMQPVTGVPVRVEVARLDEDGDETPLSMVSMTREGPQSTRFRAALQPLAPGRYAVRGHADTAERTITSAPVEIRVSDTSVEFQRTQQDRAALLAIAHRSGGRYAHTSVAGFAARMQLDARTVPSVSERTLRTSAVLFGIILLLLSAEWVIRKRAGMI